MDEFHKTGLALRKRANEALQAKQPGKAVEGFTLALTGPNGPSQKEHMAALHTGRAAAYIALRGYHFGAEHLFKIRVRVSLLTSHT